MAGDFQPLNLAQLYQGADAAVASAMQTNLMALQASKMKQEFDVEDQLRTLARRSTTTDETGNTTFNEPNFLSGARAIDPLKAMAFEKAGIEAKKAALDITKTQVETANIQDQMDERRFKQAGDRLKLMNEASTVPYMKYKELIDKGTPEPEARMQVQPLHEKAIQSLVNSNMFTKDQLAKFQLNPQFDPTTAEAGMRQVLGAKEGLAQYWEEKKFGETKRHNTATEGQATAALGETHRHNVAEEGTPESIESGAQAIASYQQPPITGRGLTQPMGAKTMERVMAIRPDYNAQNYEASQKSYDAFTSGQQGNAVRSFNTAISHLGTLDTLAEALKNGNAQMINKAGNAYASATGKSAPASFEAARQIVGDEIVKAITGGGGGVGDREKAQETVNKANSPEQLQGVISTYKELMSGQLNGLRQQYEQGTMRKDFDKFLSENAKGVEGESGSSKGGGVGDREKAQETVDKANSPEQLRGVIATYKELMSGQLKGLRQQYEQSTMRKDFDKFLSEGAKGVQDEAGGASKGGVDVPAPDGKTYSFPNQKAADEFKKRAGIK